MKKYLITSREFYTDTPAVFKNKLYEQFQKHLPDFALYRDKANPNYKTQADHFVEVCSKFMGIKSFLHRDYQLARELNAEGVHLTSMDFADIKKAKALGLEVIISTHTYKEVQNAAKEGADYVTYSPIFATPNKGEPKGIEDLENLLVQTDIKVFALGGIINATQVEKISQTSAFGFASIRYFY